MAREVHVKALNLSQQAVPKADDPAQRTIIPMTTPARMASDKSPSHVLVCLFVFCVGKKESASFMLKGPILRARPYETLTLRNQEEGL